MRFYQKGSVLMVSLILVLSILSLLFLTKDKFIQQQNITTFYSEKYLADKNRFLSLNLNNKHQICQENKKEKISLADLSNQKFEFLQYHFHCQFYSLFRDKRPSKEKYIPFTQIEDYLDLSNVPESEIFLIQTLADLPPSSEADPKIVKALNPIDENLPQNFYGIVITDYLFDIKGKKMFGTLYSSFDNAREERNLTFRKEVLAKLEEKYAYWRYLDNSSNMLGVADE